MLFRTIWKQTVVMILFSVSVVGCGGIQTEPAATPVPTIPEATLTVPASPIPPTVTPQPLSPAPDLSKYAFPGSIDPEKRYMFYLHGRIVEDQGLPAISPDYGEYEYLAILEKLSGYGFFVISEQRPKNADGPESAKRITVQIQTLLEAGVPAHNITVVGASKGGGIAIFVSTFLKNKEVNFVIMAICDPATIVELKKNQVVLYGKILSIYDSKDDLAGSCQELFSYSEGKGISRHEELVLNVGTGHGILYKPLDEWIIPTVHWAGKP